MESHRWHQGRGFHFVCLPLHSEVLTTQTWSLDPRRELGCEASENCPDDWGLRRNGEEEPEAWTRSAGSDSKGGGGMASSLGSSGIITTDKGQAHDVAPVRKEGKR